MAPSPEQAGSASGKLARSLTINAGALVICRYVFSGFEIHGFVAYLSAAAAIELPTIVWLIAIHFWGRNMFKDRMVERSTGTMRIWMAAFLGLTIVIPLVLATTAPGVALAAGITSLKITSVWTFVGASAITAVPTICLGASQPLKFVWTFVGSFAPEDQRAKSEESMRALRESRGALGPALRSSILRWCAAHRPVVRWTERCLPVVALIVGTVTVGLWFGGVLAVLVFRLPAAILWALVRSHRKSLARG